MKNKFLKWLLKLFKKIVIWIVLPFLTTLIILSVGVSVAEEKGWLFEEEVVEVIDLGEDKKSDKIIELESMIKEDIDKTFKYYLTYKTMPNILYAKESVVLMSYESDFFSKNIQNLINEERKTLFNQYKLNFVGNEQATTVQLENSYTDFIDELISLHKNEQKLLDYLNNKETLSKKEISELKRKMVSQQINLSELYNEIVQTYHVWTHKTSYLPYYDETILVIEEMKLKEDTLSVGVASSISLVNYKNILKELKDIELKEVELSLNQDLKEVNESFVYPYGYDDYIKSLKEIETEFVKQSSNWIDLLKNDKTFMQKETNTLIKQYEKYLKNRISLMNEIYIYYKDNIQKDEVYFDLFEKEILLRNEKEELNLSIKNYEQTLNDLSGNSLENLLDESVNEVLNEEEIIE